MNNSLQQYQYLIDGLVDLSKSYEAEQVKEGTWQQNYKYENILHSLSQEQREIIAEIISNTKIATIHDILVYFTDNNYKLTKDGVELAYEPYGTESYFDFMARQEGVMWPYEEGKN